MKLLYIDLFCGAGGTSTGVENARHDGRQCAKVIGCVNHDANAIASHAANHPDALHFTEDIRTLELSPLTAHIAEMRRQYPDAFVVLWASLECTNFSKAKGGQPRDADLCGATLCGADLRDADLCGADLCGADLRGAKGTYMACPTDGSFIGWKKASGYIVKLQITEDARRSSAGGEKCRCDKAYVVEIQNIDGTKAGIETVHSNHDANFVYTVGATVEVSDFDGDRWNECAPGIHFFIDRRAAVEY